MPSLFQKEDVTSHMFTEPVDTTERNMADITGKNMADTTEKMAEVTTEQSTMMSTAPPIGEEFGKNKNIFKP